MRVDDVSLWWL